MAKPSIHNPTSRARRIRVVNIPCKISSLDIMWVKCLLEHSNLHVHTFSTITCVLLSQHTLQQILLLPAPSKCALNLLPAFYRFVMSSWFRLPRRVEDGKIVIGGSRHTFPLDTLSCNTVYKQLSNIDCAEHRCVEKYGFWGVDVEWNTVWRNLHL